MPREYSTAHNARSGPTTLNGDVQGFGVLTINGDVFMDGPSKLDIDIGGTTQGTNYDELKVNGDATLGGTLNVNLVNFYPKVGDTFTVLAATTLATDRSGNVIHFAKDQTGELIPGSDGTMEWAVIYTNNWVILEVVNAVGLPVPAQGGPARAGPLSKGSPARTPWRRLRDWIARKHRALRLRLLGRRFRTRHDHDGCLSGRPITFDGSGTAIVNGTHTYSTPGVYAVRTTFYFDSTDLCTVDSRLTVADGTLAVGGLAGARSCKTRPAIPRWPWSAARQP